MAKVKLDLVREGTPQGKADDGKQVVAHVAPVSLGDVDPKQQQVPRLRVGEDLSPAQKRVRVHEPARAGEDQCQPNGLGGLRRPLS